MRATLFDFNGVLVDDEMVHFEAFSDVLAPLGIQLSIEEYTERYLGFDDRGAFSAILRDRGRPIEPGCIDELVVAKMPCYMGRATRSLVVFPGARELLQRRARLGLVGIVSGALAPEIRFGLQRIGVDSDVAFVVSAENTTSCKPDPEGYLLAAKELEKRGHKGTTVVIEDSMAGVEAAKAAGLRCVAVSHSYPRERLVRAGASRVVDTLGDLTDEVIDA